jgi:hypothetical protein
MKIIAHRANLNGPSNNENSLSSIDAALSLNFDIEIDIRLKNNEIFLGHDVPQYKIDKDFLMNIKDNSWFHCKDFDSFKMFLLDKELKKTNFFFHTNEDYALTSRKYVWTYPGRYIFSNSILVLPEIFSDELLEQIILEKPYGICTDYPNKISPIKILE